MRKLFIFLMKITLKKMRRGKRGLTRAFAIKMAIFWSSV